MFVPHSYLMYPDAGISPDFVARYLFDGDASDQNGTYNGTNNGGSYLSAGDGPGGSNIGISLGSGAYISLPTSLASALGSGSGTMVCHLRASTADGSTRIFYASDTATNNNFMGYRLTPSDNYPSITYNSLQQYTAESPVSANVWVTLALRTDGSNTFFRLNGINLSTTTEAGSDTGAWLGDVSSIDNFLIGRFVRNAGALESEDFDIAAMTWYARYLSDAECAQLEDEY